MNINPFAASALGVGYGVVQMSMIGFRSATGPVPTAKSGWYRLMLSEMQERALDEDRKRKEALPLPPTSLSVPEVETVVGVPLQPKPKRKKRVEKDVELWQPPSRPKPLYRVPAPPVREDFVAPFLAEVADDLHRLRSNIIPLRAVLKQQKQAKIVQAEEDDEEEFIELLLMAA